MDWGPAFVWFLINDLTGRSRGRWWLVVSLAGSSSSSSRTGSKQEAAEWGPAMVIFLSLSTAAS
jgi:hypothetical protein